MTNRVRIRAVATDQARLVVIEAEGSEAAVSGLVTAALQFVGGNPGDVQGAPPRPALAPPKKPRRRRP